MAQRRGPFYALATFRTGGSAVVTPVWLGWDGGAVRYCFTPARSGKVRRLQGDRRVRVAPSDFYGVPAGEWVEGTGRLLSGAERARGLRALTERYGWGFRWFRLLVAVGRWRRRGGPGVVVGIELSVGSSHGAPP